MPEPPTNYSPLWESDTRAELPLVGDERTVLTAYLDWHRETFALNCAGVPPERMSEAAVPPSDLTRHGLARHLAAARPDPHDRRVRPPRRARRPAPGADRRPNRAVIR